MFKVRPISKKDAHECARIINYTIRQGGTTAYEEEYSVDDFDAHYREEAVVCLVVLDSDVVVGFQGMFDIGEGVLSIGSFTDQENPVSGAGRALIQGSIKKAPVRL